MRNPWTIKGMLDEYNKTYLNMTRNLVFGTGHNKNRILMTVRYGEITIAGKRLNNIVVGKNNGEYIYINQLTKTEIEEYRNMKPKQFVTQLSKDGLIELNL